MPLCTGLGYSGVLEESNSRKSDEDAIPTHDWHMRHKVRNVAVMRDVTTRTSSQYKWELKIEYKSHMPLDCVDLAFSGVDNVVMRS